MPRSTVSDRVWSNAIIALKELLSHEWFIINSAPFYKIYLVSMLLICADTVSWSNPIWSIFSSSLDENVWVKWLKKFEMSHKLLTSSSGRFFSMSTWSYRRCSCTFLFERFHNIPRITSTELDFLLAASGQNTPVIKSKFDTLWGGWGGG